ncbi:protein lin-9 homolog [Polistes fuscatus]|uniref:protein lin-9 homolog n=1 Tax=Polistes fuscatus TaxID=30207 RepID=UPI001CAA17BF|nr:protein lin-9 homolog [Polistes fuscatus]
MKTRRKSYYREESKRNAKNLSAETSQESDEDKFDVKNLDKKMSEMFDIKDEIVEEKTKEMSPINRRGVPARIRKKNKLFYDDEMITTSPKYFKENRKSIAGTSVQKEPKRIKTEPTKVIKKSALLDNEKIEVEEDRTVSNRTIGEKIGPKLRNLLKLPQAHRWVCHEWFYSDVDRCLFSGDNDFELCLKETFPGFNCRKMTRVQWTIIRRMLGKPRRCSDSFFQEEREDLERRRNKIRALQQCRHLDSISYKDLPAEIPTQLTIGTRVTARLRRPQDGLFTGTVDGYDTSNNMYRITFDRQGIGSHSCYDYEVLSNDPPETIVLRGNKKGGKKSLLELIVLVTKLLGEKKLKIRRLKELNSIAERYNSYGGGLSDDYERKYASVMIKLEKLNRDLQNYLLQIRALCIETIPKQSFISMLIPSHIRERCHSEALDIIEQYLSGHQTIISDNILELIKNLTALLIVIRTISNSDKNAFDLDLLEATTEQIKNKLLPFNYGHLNIIANALI